MRLLLFLDGRSWFEDAINHSADRRRQVSIPIYNVHDLIFVFGRESTRPSPVAWQLALEYSKKEFIASTAFAIYGVFVIVFLIFSPVFMPNLLTLVFNFKILLLPFDNVFSVNWYLSYLFQIFVAVSAPTFYTCFVSITLHFMDHSCWTVDNLTILVEELRSSSQDYDRKDQENVKSLEKKLKEIVRTSCSVLEWQNEIQALLRFIFLLDFSSQAIMTGLSLTTLSKSLNASSICYVIPLVISQIFISCWMGSSYSSRVEKLTAAIYDLPWYLMDVKQRKEIQTILLMSQNMQGFDGIFYQINMETFTDVSLINSE